jgi:hypothetical protein
MGYKMPASKVHWHVCGPPWKPLGIAMSIVPLPGFVIDSQQVCSSWNVPQTVAMPSKQGMRCVSLVFERACAAPIPRVVMSLASA